MGWRSINPTLAWAVVLMGVILMMILPMPSWVLDIGLAVSFGMAILIFTVTLFIERPLDFSSFPTLLLASLMLRLSLNVSSTKLIIGQGHTGTQAAGKVIEGFASFIMGGSVFLGLVVFGVLMIVNFAVITKGAGRMAEVGARFALDAMPGKQLSIDADLSAGAISHEEAKERRQTEQAETTFFGSLDGASKFVKGDAIAGLLITILNLVMGLIMGVVIHRMNFGTALETYAILTVGDGLVSQIPAVIISIAAALLLARGGTTGASDVAIFSQIRKYPQAIGAVAAIMCVFSVVPGLPFLPFIGGACALFALAYYLYFEPVPDTSSADFEPIEPTEQSIGDLLDMDDVHIEFAPNLVSMILDQGTGLDVRIGNMRKYLAQRYGLILPQIRLTDEPILQDGEYRIKILDVYCATGILRPNHIMVLLPEDRSVPFAGQDIQEPVYHAPARWISTKDQEQAALDGFTYVTPAEVLATHLLEVLKKNFARLISPRMLHRLMAEQANLDDKRKANANKALFDELVPDKVKPELIVSVLRNLVSEAVSIRNLPLIVETLAEIPSAHADLATEFVRQKLGPQIIANLKGEDQKVYLVQFSQDWEAEFEIYQMDQPSGLQDIALPPELFHQLGQKLSDTLGKVQNQWSQFSIITSSRRRKFVHSLLSTRGLQTPVISFEELGYEPAASIVGVIDK
ncbi:flagellar biosynthesis protein FlhA [Rhodobacteraceae bacterium]|nr:flagellar biosynthesis protein FlhA [Paracoccaceae bacterium]